MLAAFSKSLVPFKANISQYIHFLKQVREEVKDSRLLVKGASGNTPEPVYYFGWRAARLLMKRGYSVKDAPQILEETKKVLNSTDPLSLAEKEPADLVEKILQTARLGKIT